jgi:hypothetical protein
VAPEPTLRNPFRSEADAFRLLVIIGVSVAAIAAAAVLGGPWLGVPLAVILIAVGTRASYRWLRHSIQAPGESQTPPGGERAPEGGPGDPASS